MIKRPLESHDQVLYLTPLQLSAILMLSGATLQPLQNSYKTVAMDTLHYTGNISTTVGSNDMIKTPSESHD